MANIILYFGSFNPVHNGHTGVARYVLDRGLCDELWFVVSPQSPMKAEADLAPEADRLEMTRIAIRETIPGGRAKASDAEFRLPRPSYTIDTLRALKIDYPCDTFSLLMGADLVANFHKWKESSVLLDNYKIYVYPREGYSADKLACEIIYLKDAPTRDFSSTDIRRALENSEKINGMVCAGVERYIKEKGLWQQ